jgi:hypothetical protein
MTMNTDELLGAAEVLVSVSARFAELPVADDDAAAASLQCMLAGLIMTKLARHLMAGVEPSAALRLAALGTAGVQPQRTAVVAMLARLMRDGQRSDL